MTADASSNRSTKPLAVPQDHGAAWWWFNSLTVIKATAADTNGQMSVLEVTEPPGEVAPLHVHHREDEAFWVIDGSATFTIGDEVVEAGEGHFLFGPRGIPHAYTAGSNGCRILFILSPGGFEEVVVAMSRPAERLELPPANVEEIDWESVATIIEERGVEILG